MASSKKGPAENLKALRRKMFQAESAVRATRQHRETQVPFQATKGTCSMRPILDCPIDELEYNPALTDQKAAGRAAVKYITAMNELLEAREKYYSALAGGE